jgi:voltage-gated potassium channel Kch
VIERLNDWEVKSLNPSGCEEKKMNNVLRGIFVIVLMGILLSAVSILGNATSYDLRVEIDPEEGTIAGVEEVMFDEGISPAIFLLLANFDREENPFLSERAIDATYPHGFDPASTTITRVEGVQSEGAHLALRLGPDPPPSGRGLV